MSQGPGVTISHVGICVSDLERSVKFYTEALGFVLEYYVDVGPPFEVLTEVPAIKGRVGFFHNGGCRIELASYETPVPSGSKERRPMTQIGLTHLSIVVENLDATVDRIVKLGGKVYPHTKVKGVKGDMIFCTCPDGIRLELWEKI